MNSVLLMAFLINVTVYCVADDADQLLVNLNLTFAAARRRRLPLRRIRKNPPSQTSRSNQARTSNDGVTISNVDKWSNGIIYYEIGKSLGRYKNTIYRAMKIIESNTCIKFQKHQKERNWIQIVNGQGCHSKVGRTGGRQTVSLGEGCHDVGSAMHELCHAIGLYHEHMRYDRDQYLELIWNNIMPSMKDQFQKIPATQYRPAARFDYNSIMIYGSKAFSKNDRKTMVPRNKRIRIYESHFKQNLSKADVVNINSLYSCSS